jgi:hypothetical protein
MMSRTRRLLAGFLVVVGVSSGLVGSAAQSTPAVPVVSLSAVLLDQAGEPLPDTSLAMGGEVRRNEAITDVVRIATATTDHEGRFTISGDPSALPTDARGAVALELDTIDAPAEHAFTYGFSALPPTSGEPNWTIELLPPAPVFQVGTGLVEATAVEGGAQLSAADEYAEAESGGTGLSAPAGETRTTEEDGQVAEEPLPRGMAVDGYGGTSCPTGHKGPIGWRTRPRIKYNHVPTKYVRTRNRARFRWRISRSHETTLEFAVNVAGRKYAGGALKSSWNENSITWTPTVSNFQKRIFKIKWAYQKQRKFCHSDLGDGGIWMLDWWRWMPKRPEAGNSSPKTNVVFQCAGTGPRYSDWIQHEVSVARNTSVMYRNWFTILGVTLDGRQLDRSDQVFTVIPDAGRKAHVCGDNDTPAYASLVKELPYN